VPAAASSPIPAALMKPGSLDQDRVADLRPYLDSVPDPRAGRGRWYSLTAILLVGACAVVSGARSIDELAEWGQRAADTLLKTIGIRHHLLGWRRTRRGPQSAACWGLLTATPWSGRWAPTWPTDTAPPPHRHRDPRRAPRASSRHSRRRQSPQGVIPPRSAATAPALRGHPRHCPDLARGRPGCESGRSVDEPDPVHTALVTLRGAGVQLLPSATPHSGRQAIQGINP